MGDASMLSSQGSATGYSDSGDMDSHSDSSYDSSSDSSYDSSSEPEDTRLRTACSWKPRAWKPKAGAVWEMCCHPQSGLTKACRDKGLLAHRFTLETGFDLELDSTAERVTYMIKLGRCPRHLWVSVNCGPWSIMQNGNMRTAKQVERLLKKRQRGLLQIRNLIKISTCAARHGAHVYWEWPLSCMAWKIPETTGFFQGLKDLGLGPYFVPVDGCAYGMRAAGTTGPFVKKPWKILTINPDFQKMVGRLCPNKRRTPAKRHIRKTIQGNKSQQSPLITQNRSLARWLHVLLWNDRLALRSRTVAVVARLWLQTALRKRVWFSARGCGVRTAWGSEQSVSARACVCEQPCLTHCLF